MQDTGASRGLGCTLKHEGGAAMCAEAREALNLIALLTRKPRARRAVTSRYTTEGATLPRRESGSLRSVPPVSSVFTPLEGNPPFCHALLAWEDCVLSISRDVLAVNSLDSPHPVREQGFPCYASHRYFLQCKITLIASLAGARIRPREGSSDTPSERSPQPREVLGFATDPRSGRSPRPTRSCTVNP